MHRVVLAALLLSACRVDENFVCSSDDQCRRDGITGACEASSYCSFPDLECESGRRYDALAPESSQCVLDQDKDTIADDGDNCPALANRDQFDDDNDGAGDVCDPCPPFSDNTDGDSDGVGDLCDPRPTIAGDSIAYFEGFHAPLFGWSVQGSAVVENDGLTLQGMADADLPITSAGRATLYAGITMVEAPTTGVWLGLPFEATAGGPFCALTTAKLVLWHREATVLTRIDEAAFDAKQGTLYVLGIQRVGNQQYHCTARAPSAMDVVVMNSLADNSSMKVGMGTDATTRFAWVMLIATAN